MKISFIGGGNMGEAILVALIGKRLSQPRDIIVSDISEPRREALRGKYGIAVTKSNSEAASAGNIVILAVKPQTLPGVLAELSGNLNPSQLVLSIIAGARIETIRRGLRHRRIIRAMPNTPAKIGSGITAWTATAQVTERQLKQARSILGAMGGEVRMDSEKYIDMATAISGSGPAYFFLLAEAMTEAAIKLGLPPDSAEALASQTMTGAGKLLGMSSESSAQLRLEVTSPGGTTAAAIDQFEKGNLRKLVQTAVKAAYKRARELGG